MKYSFITILLIGFFVQSFAQQDSVKRYSLTKQQYLEKSKINKRTGLILLLAGTVMTAGGTYAILDDPEFLGSNPADGPYVLFVGGILTMGASVPLFIISGNQAHKASTISAHFGMQQNLAFENGMNWKANMGYSKGINATPHHPVFPALAIKLQLRK